MFAPNIIACFLGFALPCRRAPQSTSKQAGTPVGASFPYCVDRHYVSQQLKLEASQRLKTTRDYAMSNCNDRTTKRGPIPPTDWSQIRHLKSAPDLEQGKLLEVLAQKYWAPIFQYLLIQGHREQEVQDMIQDFFAFAMQTRLFEKADQDRGRFRSFLLGALNNFVANEQRKKSAQKRRPIEGICSLDELVDDGYYHPKSLVSGETPEVLFHRAWVREVVRNVITTMENDFKNTGKETHFILFRTRVVSPELDGDEPPPLQQQARELGLEYKEAANQVIAAKRAFRRLLEAEVRSYVRSEDDTVRERLDVLRLMKLEVDA